MLAAGAHIIAYDPVAIHETKRKIGDIITYVNDQYEAIIDADALVLLTEWNEFRVPKYKIMAKLMKNHVIFDGRNIYDAEEMQEVGFKYFGMGRKVR
jgi:UDPglucose 6-dehydrogenase